MFKIDYDDDDTLTIENCDFLTSDLLNYMIRFQGLNHNNEFHLDLENCDNIRKIKLYKTRELRIVKCKNILYLPRSKYLELLTLRKPNFKILNIDNFKNLKSIYLEKVDALINIPKMKNLEMIQIYSCKNLETIANMKSLNLLHISTSNKIYKINKYKNLTALRLYKCKNITEIPKFKLLETLGIENCNIKKIPHFKKITYLNLDNIPITNFPKYTRRYKNYDIKNCDLLIADKTNYIVSSKKYRDNLNNDNKWINSRGMNINILMKIYEHEKAMLYLNSSTLYKEGNYYLYCIDQKIKKNYICLIRAQFFLKNRQKFPKVSKKLIELYYGNKGGYFDKNEISNLF